MPAETLPMALMRPLSGSGALGVMAETIKAEGPDSLIGRMVSVMMGSGETTFYVLAVYFGSVGITRTRQAVPAGIVADVVGILTSVWIVTWIFRVTTALPVFINHLLSNLLPNPGPSLT